MSALTASRPLLPAVAIPHSTAAAAAPTIAAAAAAVATPALTPAPASPESCYSSLPSLTHSCASSSASSIHSVPERTNEHLAILLPKALWKPDSLASRCDNFYCRTKFTVFERKHHCRKCGGVFCASCTARTTALLDTSNLAFLHPPRNVPLSTFESPESPIVPGRVCDDCWDQLHGNPTTPHTPDLLRPSLSRLLSSPIAMLKSPLSPSPISSPSSLTSSIDGPPRSASPALLAPRKTRSLRTTPSSSSLTDLRRTTVHASHAPLPPDLDTRSYGELDAYPLRHCSTRCKATGGGRWTPKHEPPLVGYRPPVPGAKALYELEMERQERDERRRRENPVIKDGAFQYRFQPLPDAPVTAIRATFSTSTF